MSGTNTSSQNLELITIFHYVVSAVIFLKGMTAFMFMGIGAIAMVTVMQQEGPDPPAAAAMGLIGIIFFVIPIFFSAVTATIGTAVLIAGRRIAKRTHLTYCQIIAGLECLCFPYGTVLGVFTLIALTRDDIKTQFQDNSADKQ